MHFLLKLIIFLIIVAITYISYLFITDKLNWDDILKILEDSFITGFKEESEPPDSKPSESKPPKSKRPKFIEGNLNWKFTSESTDIDCLRNWDYFKTDGNTLIQSNIPITTSINKQKMWCATTNSTVPTDRIPPDDRSLIEAFFEEHKADILGIVGSVALDIFLSKLSNVGKEVLAKELAEKITKETTEKIVKESAEKALLESGEKAAKEATEKALAGGSKEIVSEATEKVLKESVEKAITETTEKLIREATEKAAREGIEQVTLDLTIKIIKESAIKTANESVTKLVKDSAANISKKSFKEASEKLLKSKILNLSKASLVPKLSFKLQSKGLLSISKTLGQNSDSILKLTAALVKLGKTTGKASAKLGIKVSTKLLSLAKAFKPGPFAMFDILNFALDIADVGGYQTLQTKADLYKIKSESDKEKKYEMFNSIKKALNDIGIPFSIKDFNWPIVVDPLEDSFDDVVLGVKIMEKFNTIMATADTETPDSIIVPYLKAISDDIANGKILESGVTDEQIDKYIKLIDMDLVIKQINIESCKEVGGLIYDEDKCTLTEEKCDTYYSWPITDNDIYTEFKDGKCVQANPQLRGICDTMGLTYNKQTGICDITREYCLSKGAGWEYDDKIKESDCNIPLAQSALEIVFGTVTTRSLLRASVAAMKEVSKPPSQLFDDAMFSLTNAVTGDGYKDIYAPSEIKIKDKCLDVKDGKYPKLQIWDCNGTNNQKFLYDGIGYKENESDIYGNGRIMFLGDLKNNPNNYTYCLEVPNHSNGTQLYLNKCSNSIKQSFNYYNSEIYHSGTVDKYDIMSPPFTCIDLINDNNTNGNNFQLLGCNKNNAQRFTITKKRVDDTTKEPRFKINYKGFI